jgi:hypothetical protein
LLCLSKVTGHKYWDTQSLKFRDTTNLTGPKVAGLTLKFNTHNPPAGQDNGTIGEALLPLVNQLAGFEAQVPLHPVTEGTLD